ncbi:MAG: heavy-metal-associated domain-containing protein [Halobacteriaceae archaeon]
MTTKVEVPDMGCDGCENIIEKALNDVDGVEEVSADHNEELVTVSGSVTTNTILEKIDLAGYEANLLEEEEEEE